MCGIGLLSYLKYVHFCFFLTVQYIADFVNKTSRNKGGACSNEKREPDITLGRNYPTAGYYNFSLKNDIFKACSKQLCKLMKTIKLKFYV